MVLLVVVLLQAEPLLPDGTMMILLIMMKVGYALVGGAAEAAGGVDGTIVACVDVGWRPVAGICRQRATFKVTPPTLNRFTYGQSL
jgi:hypothetical protein